VSPSSGILDLVAASSTNRRAAAGVDRNSISVTKGSGETGIAIASGDNFRGRPNLRAESRQRLSIFGGGAAGQENSGAINFSREFEKNCAQPFWRGQTKICGWKFPVRDDSQLLAFAFGQDPGGLGSAAFHPENFLAGFHNSS
jgi:hypothetical protein